MSYQNAGRAILESVSYYGNQDRTYEIITAVRNLSAANRNVQLGDQSILYNGQGGKKRKVILNFYPVNCSPAQACSDNLCPTGTVNPMEQVEYDVNECIMSPYFQLRASDIRLVDNQWDFTEHAKQQIGAYMPQFRRAIAEAYADKLFASAGVHTNGNARKRISVTDPTTGIVNPMGLNEILREYRNAGFANQQPFLIGGADVFNWQRMVGMGGLNAQGQYVNQMGYNNMYYDDGLLFQSYGTSTSGDYIIAADPNAVKLIQYSENAGIFRTEMGSVEDISEVRSNGFGSVVRGTIYDAVTGLLFDWFLNYDKCTDSWTFWWKYTYDLWVMPNTVCSDVQGVNGIMIYNTCPYVVAPCPTGDSPSPAAAEQTFSWTPTVADISPISISTIDNWSVPQQNGPVSVANVTELAAYMNGNSRGDVTFTVNGAAIQYVGIRAISGSFNNTVNFTFA